MLRRWLPAIVVATAAFALGGVQLARGALVPAALVFIVLLAIAVALSPRGFPPSVTEAEARAAGGPIVYWRPGCPYCARLRVSLGRRAGRLNWVDIWQDPAAAATVRSLADGNETVPTLVTADAFFVNPAPGLVRRLTL